jgi:cell division protein ZapA (FtsZ GTPase activity inhibitor)
MADSEKITLTIGGQDFVLRVKPEERDDVMEAAKIVKEKMKENAERGAASVPKQAVMAAFDFAYDFIRVQRDPLVDKKMRADLERRVDSLIKSVDQALQTK